MIISLDAEKAFDRIQHRFMMYIFIYAYELFPFRIYMCFIFSYTPLDGVKQNIV